MEWFVCLTGEVNEVRACCNSPDTPLTLIGTPQVCWLSFAFMCLISATDTAVRNLVHSSAH